MLEKLFLAAIFFAIIAGTAGAATCNSILQFGITWTFATPYPECGQFANGDWWVVGPVTINSISPPYSSQTVTLDLGCATDLCALYYNHACDSSQKCRFEWNKNGSQLNPDPTNTLQGYESSNEENPYNPSLNKATAMPLTLQPNSSLVSSISSSTPTLSTQMTTIKGMSVLTILSAAAPAGAFRPPYVGNDKTIKFNQNQLDYSKLGTLTPVGLDMQLSEVERMFERPWIDHTPSWIGRSVHPADNMPDYGQYMAYDVSLAALFLNLNYSNAQKQTLMTRLVQLGIDNYGIIANGGKNNWAGDGGHASSRKFPILFAGVVLNDPTMKAIGTTAAYQSMCGSGPCFGEDSQTFYVSQSDIAITNRKDSDGVTQQNYLSSDLGLPEWGIRHYDTPTYDDRTWNSETAKSSYRYCCTAVTWSGELLGAQIMGLRTLWNHNVLFDYQDRYVAKPPITQMATWSPSNFEQAMWNAYRSNYGCTWTRDNTSDIYSNGHYNCAGTNFKCTWANSNTGTLVSSCSNYTNQRACDYDPCAMSGGCSWNGSTCVSGSGPSCAGTDANCGSYPSCSACSSGQKCCGNSCTSVCTATSGCSSGQTCSNPGTCNATCTNIQCSEGAITSACYCGGTVRTSGYCCSNAYQAIACGSCVVGTTQSCTTGLQGICSTGTKTCQANGTWPATCTQTNQPTTENCSNTLDDDCDGATDCSDSDCSSSANCQVTVPTDYIAYYKFEGNTNDETGNNNGTFQGSTATYVSGKNGQALQLDGTSNYVNLGTNSALAGGAALTVSAWVKPSASSGDIASRKDTATGSMSWEFYISSGKAKFAVMTSVGPNPDATATSAGAVNTSGTVWTHVAATYSNSDGTLRIYINGQPDGTAKTSNAIANVSMKSAIGAYFSSGNPSSFLKGSVDEVAIYNRALSAAEIQSIYSGTSAACDTPALMNYILQWKTGSTTISVLMQKIGAWKAGQPC